MTKTTVCVHLHQTVFSFIISGILFINQMSLRNTMPPKMTNSNEGQNHIRTNILWPVERSCHKNDYVQYGSSSIIWTSVNLKKNLVKCQSKGSVPTKRSYHKGYSCEISKLKTSTHYSKVISKVEVFKKWVKLQGQATG